MANRWVDFSTVGNNNTSVGSSVISENCAPSGINNSIRDLLAYAMIFFGDAGTISSASTTDIGTIAEGYVLITGTTTITAFGTPTNKVEYTCVLDDALTLTHNATSLILPGGANISGQAGDVFRIRHEGSGNWRCTDYQKASGLPVIDPPAPTQLPVISTRQTVQSGPVTSDGLPNFGGSTGSGTVTMTGTLIATAANGFSSTGQVDRVGSITDASWTGLTTDGTMYLYLDLAADGTATTGSGTLAPIYQFGGTPSTTSGQFTFNISQMTAYVGNGSAAPATYRVYVGQVTVASSVVSAITWYALNGKYTGPWTNTLPSASSATTVSHNIGTAELYGPIASDIECITTDTFAVGARITYQHGSGINGSGQNTSSLAFTALTLTYATTDNAPWVATTPAGGTSKVLTLASWKYRFRADRGW